MKSKTLVVFLLSFISLLSHSQISGYYIARYSETNNLDLIIDAKNNYSLELSGYYGDEQKIHLLSIGTAKLVEDTVFLKDKINGEQLKLVYSEERNKLKTFVGFNMLKGRTFAKSENPVDDNYYNSISVSTYELPKTGEGTVIKKGIFYTSDEKFCLSLQAGGKYIYSYDNMVISIGSWYQQKENIELTDMDCGTTFLIKKTSAKELVVKSIFGIIKFNDPHTKSTTKEINHFYLQQ